MAKPDYYYQQSAVIPYRFVDGTPFLILVSSRKKKHWIIPKGIIESDLTPLESAVKEAFEEGGIIGECDKSFVGEYKHKKWGGICTVQVYSMQVTNLLTDWPEADIRERIIIPFSDYEKFIKRKELGSVIKEFGKKLNTKG